MRSVPAAEVEEAVVAQVRHLLRMPEIIARTWAAAKRDGDEAFPERDVVITELAPLWEQLFPAEQAPSSGCWVEGSVRSGGVKSRSEAVGRSSATSGARRLRGGRGGHRTSSVGLSC